MKRLAFLVAFVVLAVAVTGCSSVTTVPFATGWTGTMTDQNSNTYRVSFGTQSDVWALVTTSGTYAAGTALNVNTSYPNATVKLIDSVGDWIQLSGTYSASKFTGTWTSDVGVFGSFSLSKDTSVQSLSENGSPDTLSHLLR